jgi:uncharacterized protein
LKIFLDTNVLVAAFAARGLCADLFRVVLAEHELVVGEVVLAELRRIRRILRQKVKLPSTQVDDLIAFLRHHIVVPKPRKHLELGIEDADDEWIIASAMNGHAEVLVTGDALLLAIVKPPLPIVSPRGLWELLAARKVD